MTEYIPEAVLRHALEHDDDPALRMHVERLRPDMDWKPDPHPWCGKHCCPPDTCDCPTPVTIPSNILEGMGTE